MIRYRDLTKNMVCDHDWMLWFKRHGFDPNKVLVSGWDEEGNRINGWVECDDDKRRVTTLVFENPRHGVPRHVQLEAPAMPFPRG